MSFLTTLFIVSFFLFVLGHILLRFAKGLRVTAADAKIGKAVHIETPIGVFDLKPKEELDSELAGILVYPGATHIESQPPEYEADVQLLGRKFRMFTATYRTTTPLDVVWEFYKRELRAWKEEQEGAGRSLVQREADSVRTVRVYENDGSTFIETKASLRGKADAASASAGISSSSSLGIVR